MMSAPCSYSSQTTKRTVADQPLRYPAIIYRRAVAEPREDRILNQNLTRSVELFIPHLQLCYTADPVWDISSETKPRNIYPIDFNPPDSCWTTRPLTLQNCVQSELTSIKISGELAASIQKLAELKKRIFGEKENQPRMEEYRSCQVAVFNIMKDEILKNIPPKEPSKFEKPLNPKLLTISWAPDTYAGGIWYARFRTAAGRNLYLASSQEARQQFDAARAEIRLPPDYQSYLDERLNELFIHSSSAAQERYLYADAALQQTPTDETLKKEKQEAFILLYSQADRSAQDGMDCGYSRCFLYMDDALRQKLFAAMEKLFEEASGEAKKAFKLAWAF